MWTEGKKKKSIFANKTPEFWAVTLFLNRDELEVEP